MAHRMASLDNAAGIVCDFDEFGERLGLTRSEYDTVAVQFLHDVTEGHVKHPSVRTEFIARLVRAAGDKSTPKFAA